MLSLDQIEQIRAGSWEIDCSEITLTGRGGSVQDQGPGSLRQMPTGRLGFKLYGNVSGSKLFAFGSGAAGEIIPDSEFYDLHAIDITGRAWTSEHFLVHERGTVDGSRSVFTAELWRLVHRYEFRGFSAGDRRTAVFSRSRNPVE